MNPNWLRQYKTVKTTAEQNTEYIDLMESAIDKAEQAIAHITYTSFPQVNSDTIEKIKGACRILEEALQAEIYKVSL